MIGSSKKCTSATKPIQLPSNLHGLNSLRLTNQVLLFLHQQQLRRKQLRQKLAHHLFLKQHNKFHHLRHQLLLHQLFQRPRRLCPLPPHQLLLHQLSQHQLLRPSLRPFLHQLPRPSLLHQFHLL
jgi:hypothetical protein